MLEEVMEAISKVQGKTEIKEKPVLEITLEMQLLDEPKDKPGFLESMKNVILESYKKVEQFVEDVKEKYSSVKGNYVDEEYNSPYKKPVEEVKSKHIGYEEVIEIQKQAKQASLMGCGYKLWDVLEWFQYQFWKMTAEAGELQSMMAYELA